MLKVEEKYSWYHLDSHDVEAFASLKTQLHFAIQNVAAVGRMFLGESERDENAALIWVPGLWRMAGKWIKANDTFRSSLSFEDFTIYLVNKKVKTLASLYLGGKTQRQILVWLEEHIINLELSSAHLRMILPYDLPGFRTGRKSDTYKDPDLALCKTIGGHFHNAFFLFSKMKEVEKKTSKIIINPQAFDINMQIILKDTGEEATNTYLTVGYSPGDEFYGEPYYFVKSWPHVPDNRLRPLKTRGFWHEDDWIGAVYMVRNLWDSTDQPSTAHYFFQEATKQMRRLLMN